ncbi:MAG TPA: preprotein translocase subunit SecG [bacterium]|nr:preprotein translocase subunit SecG [bacterium]HPN32218.1 preprotein translocase subunit SecG [bacterium]
MFTLHTFILIIHILVCVELIIVVLLQVGKGNSLGGLFGGSSQTVFGTQGETVMSKVTTFSAIAFMITSIVLSLIPAGHSVIKKSPPINVQTQSQPQQQSQPVDAGKSNPNNVQPSAAVQSAVNQTPVSQPQVQSTPPAVTKQEVQTQIPVQQSQQSAPQTQTPRNAAQTQNQNAQPNK